MNAHGIGSASEAGHDSARKAVAAGGADHEDALGRGLQLMGFCMFCLQPHALSAAGRMRCRADKSSDFWFHNHKYDASFL